MFILGKKLKMTQVWKEEKIYPATVVEAGPSVVTQIKTMEKDGYRAIQLGFDPTKKRMTKALAGHLKKTGKEKMNVRHMREFRMRDDAERTLGDLITVSIFKEGDMVKVTGMSKGRGFQGVVKRHGFGGGPKTHGQKNRHRAPGSIGATAPQRVLPGLRMAGRMGNDRITIKNLEVLAIDADKNLMFLKGALPGNRGALVKVERV